MAAHGPAILLVGTQEPPTRVEYDQPLTPGDSGYTLVLADRADDDPDQVPDDELSPACIGCAISRWPDLQSAMTIARRHGTAEVDPRGRWAPPLDHHPPAA